MSKSHLDAESIGGKVCIKHRTYRCGECTSSEVERLNAYAAILEAQMAQVRAAHAAALARAATLEDDVQGLAKDLVDSSILLARAALDEDGLDGGDVPDWALSIAEVAIGAHTAP